MPQPHSHDGRSPKTLIQRLERVAGELNSLLLAVAIGLAVLDITCLIALKVSTLPVWRYDTAALSRSVAGSAAAAALPADPTASVP
jgi:hypothetical protein